MIYTATLKNSMALSSFKALSVALILIIAGVTSARSEEGISPHEANDHVGEFAMVCGVIAAVNRELSEPPTEFWSPSTNRTFLYFNELPPSHEFMAVIKGSNRRVFPDEPESFVDHKACVYGKIVKYKSKPAIVLHRSDQLAVEQVGKSGK